MINSKKDIMDKTLIAKSKVHAVETIGIGTHPAVQDIIVYLDSIAKKDIKAFAACFGSCNFRGFFANLPGAVKVRDTKKFIEMHKGFFESKTVAFSYGELTDGLANADFFMCSTTADVTLPDGKKRRVNIDMTFLKNAEPNPLWIPIRFINTVIDLSQAVLHE